MTEKITFAQRAKDFEKVLTFYTLNRIRHCFESLDKYTKSSKIEKANKLHSMRNFAQRLTRFRKDGEKIPSFNLRGIIAHIGSDKIVYHGKVSRKYGAKSFSLPSWFEIPSARLVELFSMENTSENPFDSKSDFYTKRQHKLIDKYVFGFGKKEKETKQSSAIQTNKENTIEEDEIEEMKNENNNFAVNIPPEEDVFDDKKQKTGNGKLRNKYIAKIQELIQRRVFSEKAISRLSRIFNQAFAIPRCYYRIESNENIDSFCKFSKLLRRDFDYLLNDEDRKWFLK